MRSYLIARESFVRYQRPCRKRGLGSSISSIAFGEGAHADLRRRRIGYRNRRNANADCGGSQSFHAPVRDVGQGIVGISVSSTIAQDTETALACVACASGWNRQTSSEQIVGDTSPAFLRRVYATPNPEFKKVVSGYAINRPAPGLRDFCL